MPSVAVAFLLTAGTSLAFVLGGVMVYSTLLLSLARPVALVVVFSTASFIFLCTALADLLPLAHGRYVRYLQSEENADASTADGLAHLFGAVTLAVGVIMLYAVDAVIYRLSVLASSTFRQLPHAPPPLTGVLDLRVDMASTSALPFDRYRSHADVQTDCSTPVIPELSAMSPHEPFGSQGSSGRLCAATLSAVAVVVHHIPEGMALYVCAIQALSLGVAVAAGIVLHSLPDGIALASSVYFASGRRHRGVLWCLLSPVGKLLGALAAWLLLGAETETLNRAVVTGLVAGVLVGIGVKEVLPTTHNYAVGKSHGTVVGVVLGMVLMAGSKFLQ
ncbi:hypothetical protein P43SY_005017 [Pythium insidiosum]|uniref:Uncharacterized protein n=1 Tax=Pythium insidiosum TaxID=114742 RepID=A0AAD5Q9S0_PYTIN|nr:hypothetical protein P43SY_005017 [Pythium insidiosum]